ncbi:hypothetical protein J4210_02490 [Candidatus Woesearchaeota archaeon]|nr:hypothetical protein [Candidatus Woesearchaeota archaeon]
MNLIQESYQRLFPEKPFIYETEMEYNRRLGDFNANISLSRNKITLHLNLQWKDIDDEIKIGLIQHLLLKIFKGRAKTQNLAVYTNFVRNIPIFTPKTKSNPTLEESFQRVNQQFFSSQMEMPNLTWGQDSFRKLACYNFHNDTITVSTLFQDSLPHILDYLMYHEMLHKHFQFKHTGSRHSYHNSEFREAERQYPDFSRIDKEISQIIHQKRTTKRRQQSLWKRMIDI